MVDSWGMDGDIVQIIMPIENDVSKSVATSKQQYRGRLESSKLDVEDVSRPRGGELSKIPIELKSGTQWLHSWIEIDGYEEYSATEYWLAGCSEEYKVIERDFQHAREDESLILEGDIGWGLVLQRVHSNFTLLHSMETLVLFTSIDRSKHEIRLLGINFMNGIICRMVVCFPSTFYEFFFFFLSESMCKTKENLD
ncbi:hypothetical protein P3X46_008979 [Hevea brasiliensis]|uniref:Uncharacterized protein n=1 Tax=Hevea brasiliensis TaxID=3981 RepID=A0ABQ9MNV9_HEVBR|nr:hypothetical protein P3X46_008979 [Hevea brasiliensis]